MKIAFIGDSFCADSGPLATDYAGFLGYPDIVAKWFNAEILATGRAGSCLYHSYKDLLEVVDEADYIIFCVTDPYRLPNRHSVGLNLRTIEEELEKIKDPSYEFGGVNNDWNNRGTIVDPDIQLNMIKIANLYYNDIADFDYMQIMHTLLLKEIDQLMIEKEKKCIWFESMAHCFCDYLPVSGLRCNTELSHSALNIKVMHEEPTLNHGKDAENKRMANVIIDLISHDSFEPREFDMLTYFQDAEVLKVREPNPHRPADGKAFSVTDLSQV